MRKKKTKLNNHSFAFVLSGKREEKKSSRINLLYSRFPTITQLIMQFLRSEGKQNNNHLDKAQMN